MAWIVIYVALAVGGLVVLALLAVRLWRQVRTLAKEVGLAGERLRAAAVALEQRPGPRRSAGADQSQRPAGVP